MPGEASGELQLDLNLSNKASLYIILLIQLKSLTHTVGTSKEMMDKKKKKPTVLCVHLKILYFGMAYMDICDIYDLEVNMWKEAVKSGPNDVPHHNLP